MTTTTAPHTVIEYGIGEHVDGALRLMPHAGSWYTDRCYTDDLTGRDAAEAAIVRIAAVTPGRYELVELRTFLRAHDAGLADEGDEPGECEGHESLGGADMGVTVFCDGTCR